MEPAHATLLSPQELIRLVWSKRKLWLATSIACGALAAAFSLIMPRYWEAFQGLVVRQETAGSVATRPGKFADLYEMRTLQETILELAKSQQVVVATLAAIDHDSPGGAVATPTLEDIDKFRQRLKMVPPDGGEFGKTEVFYFCVKDPNRDRAIRLVGEMCVQLEAALKELRAHRAENLIAELQQQAALAAELLGAETQRLMEFETQVGADLGELRMLHSANAGQSDLRTEAVQLEAEVRKFRTQVREAEKLLALLRMAEDDPQQLVATPNSLLTTQSALRRLKDGLVDAQLATSRLGGTRSADHPRVRAAAEAERKIREDLHDELLTAIRGAEVELQLSRDRLTAAEDRGAELQRRLNRLAEMRAEYSNRVAAVDSCRLGLDRARQDLTTAKAAEAAAHSGSLVTRLDEPETGPYPAGPGRTVITAAGGVAGLMMGLGLTFLLVSPRPSNESLASDTLAAPTQREAISTELRVEPRSVEPSRPATTEWWEGMPGAAIARTPAEERTPTPTPAPVTTPRPAATATTEQPRPRRETLPTAPSALPAAAGSQPSRATVSNLTGLTLQEALQAAARLSS